MSDSDLDCGQGGKAQVFLRAIVGGLFLLGAFQALGCGDDDDNEVRPDAATMDAAQGVSGDGGEGGEGGSGGGAGEAGGAGEGGAGSGGTTPSGGSGGSVGPDGGTAGQAGSSVAGSGGTGPAGGADGGCVYTGEPLDLSGFDECTLCDNAHCVATDLVEEDLLDRLADCEDGESKCVPDMYIETMGAFVLESCTSLEGAEGRCVSLCIPEVAEQEDVLPQDVCADDERCAPCFDPVTGDETGSCEISCDTGPTEDRVTFEECCDGISVCVPAELVLETDRDGLGQDSCSNDDYLCAPKAMASDPQGYVPESCTSWEGAEARCLPACLPEAQWNAPRIAQHGCPDDYICAPCYDHVTGEEQRSCNVGADTGPTQDKVVFPRCCDDLGVCVPVVAIDDEDEDTVARDTCEEEDDLCVPEGMALAPTRWIPDYCESWNGSEGRCLPDCLPDVADAAATLNKGTCVEEGCDCEEDRFLCVPCFDPITGDSTDACSLTDADEPQDEEEYTFPECCDALGVCIPNALLDDEEVAMLGPDTCTGTNTCVPKGLAEDDTGWVPEDCDSWNGSEGRCLPECMKDVQDMADNLNQGDCDTGYLCVPCFDPVYEDPTPTGACTITEADEPQDETPYSFPDCCDGISICVPNELVDDDQEPMLGADTCDAGNSCVPAGLAADPTGWVPEDCDSWDNAEGRCLPECMQDVADMADSLMQGDCDTGYLCVPCFDPLIEDPTPTGACTITEADEPQDEDPYSFPDCCDGVSKCIPPLLVDDDQEDLLGNDTCTDRICVPLPVIADPTGWIPDDCDSWNGSEGRCLPACLPDVLPVADTLFQGDCDDGYLCSPCFDPLTGDPTGSCLLNGDTPQDPEPYTFPDCCDGISTCIPAELVTLDDPDMLDGDDTCPPDNLCVPNTLVAEPTTWVPDACRSWGNAEGRCLPECLPDVEADADVLTPGTCEEAGCDCETAGFLCVPCFDPVYEEPTPTGACTLNGDAPQDEEPYHFPRCCEKTGTYRGTCVPRVLAGEGGDELSGEECGDQGPPAEDFVCAPTELVVDPDALFPSNCEIFLLGTMQGLCMADCFLPSYKEPGDLADPECDDPALGECLPCDFGAPCYPVE